MNEDEEVDEQQDEQESARPRNTITNSVSSLGSGIINGIKNLWRKLPTLVKIKLFGFILIVILIIVAAITLNIIKEKNSDVVISHLNNTILGDNNILGISGLRKEYYEDKGSFIYFTTKEYNKLYDEYLSKTKENEVYKLFEKNGLLKKIFETEQSNFNGMKWNLHDHYKDNVDIDFWYDINPHIKLTMPAEFCITGDPNSIPKDAMTGDAKEVVKLTQPYLQTWYIPFSAAISTLSSKESSQNQIQGLKDYEFVEQVRNICMSEIELNWYKINICSVSKSYGIFTRVTTTTYLNVSEDENGNLIETTETLTTTEEVNTYDTAERVKTINVVNRVYIKHAETFDYWEDAKFSHHRYDDKDVQNDVNPDSEDIVEIGPHDVDEDVEVEEVDTSKPGRYVVAKHVVETGTDYEEKKLWQDRVSREADSGEYDRDDVIDFNKKVSGETEEEKFRDDLVAMTEFGMLEEQKKINTIDMLNSCPALYSKYMDIRYNNNNRPQHLGMQVSYLDENLYSELRRQFTELKNRTGNIPFVYGRTLGLSASYFGSGNAVGGIGAGISAMVNSAINLGNIRPWHYCQGAGSVSIHNSGYISHNSIYNRIHFQNAEELNKYIGEGFVVGTDCSAFVWSMYKTYTGVSISGPGGAGSSASIRTIAEASSNKGTPIPGAENVTATYGTIDGDWSKLKPGDVLAMNGHVGLFVGIIDGVPMQVDHGGGGAKGTGGLYCTYPEESKWKGPIYRDARVSGYTHYIHYDGITQGGIVEGDIMKDDTITPEDKAELLLNIDNDVAQYNGNTQWGTNNGAWTLRYYMDNPVELMARMICHENSLKDSQINDEGAREMVKCQTLILMKRAQAYDGSVYRAIIAKGQFYSQTLDSGARFNRVPPQWVRELVYNIYNGIEAKPSYWDDGAYFWVGPADALGAWGNDGVNSNVTQIAAIRVGTSWHVIAKNGKAKMDIAYPAGQYTRNDGTKYGWKLFDNIVPASGYTSVFVSASK